MPGTPDHATAHPRRRRHTSRVGQLVIATAVGVAMVAAALPTGQALASDHTGTPAARPHTRSLGRSSGAARDDPSTTANVVVVGAILLSSLTSSFILSGVPGDTPVNDGAVTMNVFTNNSSGYNVTVEAASGSLAGTPPNTDTIPVSDISVEETGSGGPFLTLSSTTADVVYTKATRSAAAPGDHLSNDYEFNTPIPDVLTDTYSDTLNYVATVNP
jgi:hypothetical protein